MNISVKKFSKKSLSLLIALIMVISAMPFSPLSSPIEANAAETKTTILVWDASRATANTARGARYSYKDSQSKKTISGIQWGSQTHNSTYLTVSNTALSFAEINNSGEITGNDNIEDLGIRGNKWSFSAKFAYTGSATKTTVFGLSSTTKRNYTQKNTGGSPEISNGYVADLVDIRANGDVYLNDTWTSKVSGISSDDLASSSATSPKTLTVTYDNGNLTIDIDETQKISQRVDTALFSAGVGNYLAGPNVQVFAGADSGIYPHYKVTNNGDYLYNMNLYSLSGATYTTKTSHDNPNQTINVAGFGVMKSSNPNATADRRKDNNTAINIVNDRYDTNFDIGFINFNISGLKNSNYVSVKNAICAFQARYADRGDNKGLKLYYPTKKVTEFTTSEATTGNVRAVQITTSNSSIFGKTQGAKSTHLVDTINYYGLTAIPSGEFTVNNSYADKSLDISEAINYALDNNLNYATVIILLRQAGGATTDRGDNKWTDTYFKFTSSSITATAVDACIWNDYHPDPANAGQHIRECEVCHKTETQDHDFDFLLHSELLITVPENGDDNGYKYIKCLNCDAIDTSKGVNGRVYMDVSSYWETYNAQLTQSQDKIENTAKYTSDSIKAVQDIIDEVAPVKDSPTKSQGYIQAKTNALATATTNLDLHLRQYSITFNVVDEFGKSTETVINAQSYDYGTLLNLQLPDTYQENAVSAWKRNINGVDSVVGATSHSLQVMVTGKATYTAFVKKATTTPVNHVVITLNNKSNKVYDIGYVAISNSVPVTVDVDNGTITVGGQELTAPTYSFYKVKGFKINGDTVSSGTINITGDIVITPEYEAISSFTITGGDGVVEKSTTTSWDQRVRLTAETPAQAGKINKWTSTINGQNVVWGYGDTLSFQATQACTVECTEVDATEFNGAEDVKLSVDYVSYNLYRSNSITAISRVVAPEGIVEEYGTILKTANVKSGATNENYETQKLAVDNKDNYKVTNKSGVFKSTQMISNTNQFAYNFYSAQNYDKMYVGAVAYAKLSNGTYVYSDVVTYEFKR